VTPSNDDDHRAHVDAIANPIARAIAAEIMLFRYAFVGPFVRRPLRDNELGYTEKSSIGGVVFGLGFVAVVEGLVVHLALHAWSARAAWIVTALNVYAIVWLAAAFQAARLRPVAITPERLLVRASFLWTIDIPRAAIVEAKRVDETPRDKDIVRAAFGVAPNVLVTTRDPVTACGPMGMKKQTTRVALYVDDPGRLDTTLNTQ
jgi:hypothetical protein